MGKPIVVREIRTCTCAGSVDIVIANKAQVAVV